MRFPLFLAFLVTLVAVAGCAKRPLHDLRKPGNGPDEFMIQPVKPLTAPKDYAVLPAPTPGAANLTDPNPKADAVVALGGRASALEPTGVPSSDAALVTASSRYGVPQNTRASINQEDADYRRRQGRMTSLRLFPVDRYEQVYRRQAMDPFTTNEAFRNAGYPTPTAPPGQ